MFNQQIIQFLSSLEQQFNCQPFLVGGAVRDALLGNQNPKDLDIEVFGINGEDLASIAEKFGSIKEVGKSFSVIKLNHSSLREVDLSLPRRDNKVGKGHKGFVIEADPNMSFEEACSRRDFTINSMMWSPSKGLIDPFQGKDDLESRILRHTSLAFAEDPLRVLRGMQFAARFNMIVAPETAELCKLLKSEFHTLSIERVWGEWWKWATKSTVPSKGIKFLEDVKWLDLFPHISAMKEVPQDPTFHPEGKVLHHTSLVCNAGADIVERESLDNNQKAVLLFSCLTHDMAKPDTTQFIKKRWRAIGHEKQGGPIALDFLKSIGAPKWIGEKVQPLVENHLAHCHGDISKRTVNRLANRLGSASIQELAWLVEADHSGRPPLPKGMPEGMKKILEVASQHKVEEQAPKPLVQGRNLIEVGLTPGLVFGKLLNLAFQAQLDGQFNSSSEGIEWLRSNNHI